MGFLRKMVLVPFDFLNTYLTDVLEQHPRKTIVRGLVPLQKWLNGVLVISIVTTSSLFCHFRAAWVLLLQITQNQLVA